MDDREGLAGDGEARESEDGFVSWDRESIKLTLNDGRVFRIQPEQIDLDAYAALRPSQTALVVLEPQPGPAGSP